MEGSIYKSIARHSNLIGVHLKFHAHHICVSLPCFACVNFKINKNSYLGTREHVETLSLLLILVSAWISNGENGKMSGFWDGCVSGRIRSVSLEIIPCKR